MKALLVAGTVLLSCSLAFAQAAGSSGTPKKKKGTGMDLTVPSFQAIPTADGLKSKNTDKLQREPSVAAAADPVYSVLWVKHGRGTPRGDSFSGGELSSIAIKGNPPTIEPFASAVRVKCPQKVSAPIEVVLLDRRQDTVMTVNGKLSFDNKGSDEVSYHVDWDATPWPSDGEFTFLVRVDGRPLGSFPAKFVRQ